MDGESGVRPPTVPNRSQKHSKNGCRREHNELNDLPIASQMCHHINKRIS